MTLFALIKSRPQKVITKFKAQSIGATIPELRIQPSLDAHGRQEFDDPRARKITDIDFSSVIFTNFLKRKEIEIPGTVALQRAMEKKRLIRLPSRVGEILFNNYIHAKDKSSATLEQIWLQRKIDSMEFLVPIIENSRRCTLCLIRRTDHKWYFYREPLDEPRSRHNLFAMLLA